MRQANFEKKKRLLPISKESEIFPDTVRYRGLTIGKFTNVQRAGWFYKNSNKIYSFGKVRIDKILMTCGIRTMTLRESKESKGKSFNRRALQQILFYFMLMMLCRWTVLTLGEAIPIEEQIYGYLGDFMDGYGSKWSRLYYKVEILMLATATLVTHYLMIQWEKDPKRNKWLEVLSFMDKKKIVQSYGIPEGVATNIWERSSNNLKFYFPIIVGGMSSTISAIILECQYNRGNQSILNWIWTGLDILWLIMVSLHFSAFITIFDIFTHYFDIRVEKLVFDTEQIYKYRKEVNYEDRNDIIWSMLKEFDTICVQLRQVDYFWQYFLIMMVQMGPFAVLVGANNNFVFRTRMKSEFHYIMIWLLTFMILSLWLVFMLRASKTATKMHQYYLVLNRACLIPLNDSMKVRMEHAVKKFDGLQIGFNCFSMFTIGHEYLYHVSVLFILNI